MKTETLDALLAARADKHAVVLVTDLDSGEERLVGPDGDDPLAADAADALRADRSGVIERDGRRLFLHVHNPPLRLIVLGAVHIAQPLARMAVLAGYDVTVVDPRETFASAERFPGVGLSHDWPDDALTALRPDTRTAVVALTHDPKLDDPALMTAIRSPAFYVGALGSKRTHASRRERLLESGAEESEFARICGPIGLDIGAKSPAEIAIAIMAQITDHLRKAT